MKTCLTSKKQQIFVKSWWFAIQACVYAFFVDLGISNDLVTREKALSCFAGVRS